MAFSTMSARLLPSITDGRYKLVTFEDDKEPAVLLYDRATDPNENHDIAAQNSAIATRLHTALGYELSR